MNLRFVNSYKFQYTVTLVLLFLTILVLEFASSYAYCLNDVNGRPAFPWLGEVTSTPFSYMWGDFSIGILALEIFVFAQPFFSILVAKRHPRLRLTWFFCAVVLFLMALSTIGSGGDRKGCTACLGVFYFQLFLLPIPTIVTMIYTTICFMKNKQR